MKYCLKYQLLSIRLTTDQNQDPYSGRVSANCENPADRSTYNMNGISSVTFCVDCKFARRFCITPTVFCLLVDKIIENLTLLFFFWILKSAEVTSINGRIPHTWKISHSGYVLTRKEQFTCWLHLILVLWATSNDVISIFAWFEPNVYKCLAPKQTLWKLWNQAAYIVESSASIYLSFVLGTLSHIFYIYFTIGDVNWICCLFVHGTKLQVALVAYENCYVTVKKIVLFQNMLSFHEGPCVVGR